MENGSNILEENLPMTKDFNKDSWQGPKTPAKTIQELLQDKSVNVLAWPNQNLDLADEADLTPEWSCTSKTNATELERFCREEYARITKSMCVKFIVLHKIF